VPRCDVALAVKNAVRHDGEGRVTLELARRLVARGHKVTVYAHSLEAELEDSVRFRRIPQAPGPSAVDNLFVLATTSVLMRRGQHDVACIVGPCAVPRAPFVYYAHFSHLGWRATWSGASRPRLRHRLHSRTVAPLETFCVRRSQTLLAVAPGVVTAILGGSAVPSVVVPNGVDVDEFPVVTPEERSAERARLALPDSAFVVAIAMSGNDDRLLVAGRGDTEALMAGARRRGIADRVLAPGFSEPAKILAVADAVAIPSTYEPFSLVALEAAARGIPVVVSAAAGAAAVLENAAVVIDDPTDPARIRAALGRVQDDLDGARARARMARQIAEGLRWEIVTERAARVIEKAAAAMAGGQSE
jgi:glycosyltransferase involved in cell wall biosynthesis